MKLPKLVAPLSIFVCVYTSSYGQSFEGFQESNGSAVSSIYQPGLIVSNSYLIKVNAFSLSAFVGNDIYEFKKSYLLSASNNNGTEGTDYFKKGGKDGLGGNYSTDWIGPAAAYNIDNRDYIGIFTRYRQVASITGLNNNILQLTGNTNNSFYNQDISGNNIKVNVQSFAEIGASYGRLLLNNGTSKLAAGINLKYIIGISAFSFDVKQVNVNIHDSTRLTKLNGDIASYYSSNISGLNDVLQGGLGNSGGKGGLGVDLGLAYEYSNNADGYLVRAALAVTDIGAVSYNAAPGSNEYAFNADGATTSDIQMQTNEQLTDYYKRMQAAGYLRPFTPASTFKMSLPTALRGNIDAPIANGLYANASALLNLLPASSSKYGAGYISDFILTPRYERRWFAAGLPLSVNAYGNASAGIMLRGGPLFIGSSSIISDLFSSNISFADIYIGLQWVFGK